MLVGILMYLAVVFGVITGYVGYFEFKRNGLYALVNLIGLGIDRMRIVTMLIKNKKTRPRMVGVFVVWRRVAFGSRLLRLYAARLDEQSAAQLGLSDGR